MKHKKRMKSNITAKLVLLPTIIAIAVFVYGFIIYTVRLSFSNWNSLIKDMSFAGWKNYSDVFKSFRFQSDIRNMICYTVLFIAVTIILGMVIAIVLDKGLKGTGFFRMTFLIPMAISAVVTGVAWRWILNPEAGVNILFNWNFKWYTDTSVIPSFKAGNIELGFPVAILGLVIAAFWQMSGFAITNFLSGLAGISEDIKEAARVDGASKWVIYTKIVIPMMKPVILSVFILMFQISLKVFDLIYTMTGAGPNYVTDMPAINMYETTFRGMFYAQGAVIAVCMLLIVAAFVIPYQLLTRKE